MQRPRIGISACLLGHRVRHDGQHKKQDWLVDELGRFVDWAAVCPEMEMGLGAPRETLRLVGDPGTARLIGNLTLHDFTTSAQEASRRILQRTQDVDGWIFKKDSPSCGLERVKIYPASGIPLKEETGIFAREALRHLDPLPMIEEGRLTDPVQRENFVIQLFAWARFRRLERNTAALQRFHREYKLLLMARDPKLYAELGRIAASPLRPAPEVLQQYGGLFLSVLSKNVTPKKTANALQHMFGYFKSLIDSAEKRQILEVIEDYRRGEASLDAPLALIRHLSRKHHVDYLSEQALFQPYPKSLKLSPAA